ncbi:MAG: hypothetical protein SYC29_02825 [Planctomycetota bacterium]|nr:hypothetical protein [Planctomycetota bacterium]
MATANRLTAALVVMAVVGPMTTARAQFRAPLFDSVDENFNPVSMADMIDGRPLVLVVSSCT